MERDRENGNGAAGYGWTIDERARQRLDALDRWVSRSEERDDDIEARLKAIELAQARRQAWIDNMAGLAKALGVVLVTLATLAGVLLSYLTYVRH